MFLLYWHQVRNMDKKILKTVTQYKKDSDRDKQRYELLKRNKVFLKELRKVKKEIGGELFFKSRKTKSVKVVIDKPGDNILLLDGYPEDTSEEWKKRIEKEKGKDKKQSRSVTIKKRKSPWNKFCERWHIKPEWNGRLDSLKGCLERPVELFVLEEVKKKTAVILIRIDNWTILNDIREVWNKIEDAQNSMWKKQEKRSNFARDLCWYDLNINHGLKPKEIGSLWVKYFPEEIELFVIRRIKKDIKKQDLGGKALTDDQLLHEIKTGFLSAKYKPIFLEERDYYLKGKMHTGAGKISKFNPPFLDVIRKAIQRMEEQINQARPEYMNVSAELDKYLHFKDWFLRETLIKDLDGSEKFSSLLTEQALILKKI